MASFTIVGKRFSPSTFSEYVGHLTLDAWRPDLVVLHNTAVPRLHDRPQGLSEGNLEDLRRYYADVQGWSGGPHLFVDQNGIWVFNPLDRPGVHSPSWNHRSWGVEMLGDFSVEPFECGEGRKVRTNAVAALATLFRRLGVTNPGDADLRLHKEDPRTTHDCPGHLVEKAAVLASVAAILEAPKVVVYRRGKGEAPSAILDAKLTGETLVADAAALSEATGISSKVSGLVAVRAFVAGRFDVAWHPDEGRAYLVERGCPIAPVSPRGAVDRQADSRSGARQPAAASSNGHD